MTEAEWQSADDPDLMLRGLGPTADPRCLRLFMVACACRVLREDVDATMKQALDVAERWAEGLARASEATAATQALKLGHKARAARVGITRELDPVRLAVLADAAEDAEAEALSHHLRSKAPHVLGCWALDALLGTST